MRGTLGAWKCPTSRVVGCLARWWVRSSGQEGTSLSQASLGHPGRAIPRRESAQQPRRAVVVTWRTRVSPSPPSSGPRRASGRAWGAPDVSFLFYSYTPAGASLLGALLSGTNSPSAPVRSSVRRRARGRKGHAWSRKTERRSRSLVEESEGCPGMQEAPSPRSWAMKPHLTSHMSLGSNRPRERLRLSCEVRWDSVFSASLKMETERKSGPCQGHRTGIQSHTTPGHSRSSEEKSQAGREEAVATVPGHSNQGSGRRRTCARGTVQAPRPVLPIGDSAGALGNVPQPIPRRPLPLLVWPPFLPLSHHVPVLGLRCSSQVSSKQKLFAIHISTPEDQGQHAGRLPKPGAPVF
ncbi:uncharacterized protein [Equus przewalskii]|uniref:Uncharacterized protein isoform X1 n=1 Tax=Equus przewalskii TaxID=9798 RepID=A0ABM4P9F3_EQUPR